MRKIQLLGFAMGLSFMALHPYRAAAAPTCEQQCQMDYQQCQQICSQNPCFVSCDTTLQACLSNCGSNG